MNPEIPHADVYKTSHLAYLAANPYNIPLDVYKRQGKDRDGTVKGYYEKKGQPDYKGILRDGTGIMLSLIHI